MNGTGKTNPDAFIELFEEGRTPFVQILTPDEQKALKSHSASAYNSDILKYEKVDRLTEDDRDDMTDLADREITAIALYRAFNDHICPIPSTMAFIQHVHSLRRSRDRMGRQEWVEIFKRPPSYSRMPYDWEEEEKQNPGMWQKFKNKLSGK